MKSKSTRAYNSNFYVFFLTAMFIWPLIVQTYSYLESRNDSSIRVVCYRKCIKSKLKIIVSHKAKKGQSDR